MHAPLSGAAYSLAKGSTTLVNYRPTDGRTALTVNGGFPMQAPSASYSLTVRLENTNRPGMLGRVTSAIGKAGGDIGAIDLVQVGKSTITRDLTFKARDERHGQQIVDKIRGVASVKVVNVSDRTFLMHLG